MDWIFQSSPKRYDINDAIRQGTDRNWAMNQHRDIVSVDDRVFFWESGTDARLIAVGHVTSPVYTRDATQFGKYVVDINYDYRVDPPLTRSEIKACGSPLAEYKAFGWLMGTNHPLKDVAVLHAIEEVIKPRLVELSSKMPLKGTAHDSQVELDRAIKNAKLQTARALEEVVSVMDPIAFEWLIRAVLAELGYVDIKVTKPSNDGGIDLRARLVTKGVSNIKTAVQAKRTATVGRPVVQNLRGSLTAHESGLLVTSGTFTPGAEQEAEDPTKSPIALINGEKLMNLMLEFSIGAREKSYKVYSLQSESLTLEKLKEVAGPATADGEPGA